MKNLKLLSVLGRQQNAFAIRGPKKKKGGGGAAEGPVSTDIVNIWKDRSDPKIVATDKYPTWLVDLLQPKYMPDDVMLQLYRGERLPGPKEQWTLAKSMRRTFMKDNNVMFKRDWHYESDDDFGEDLGQDAEQEDFDEEFSDEEEGGKPRQKTEEELLMEQMK